MEGKWFAGGLQVTVLRLAPIPTPDLAPLPQVDFSAKRLLQQKHYANDERPDTESDRTDIRDRRRYADTCLLYTSPSPRD